MKKYPTRKHRYIIRVGAYAGQVFEGQEIGCQDFPGQFDEWNT